MKIELEIPEYEDFIEELSKRVANRVTNRVIEGHDKAVRELSNERERIMKNPNILINSDHYFENSSGKYMISIRSGRPTLRREIHRNVYDVIPEIDVTKFYA